MNRDEALKLLTHEIDNANLLKHMYAVEVIMMAMAERFGADARKWGIAGLLHDIDLGRTNGDMTVHGHVGAEILRENDVDADIVRAVLAHAEKAQCSTDMDKALYAVDPLTGLIVAAALIHPDKRLASITTEFVINRYGEKGFARGARREAIATCDSLGLSLEEFVNIGLTAMQSIAADLDL